MLTERLRGIVRGAGSSTGAAVPMPAPVQRDTSQLEDVLGGSWYDDGRCFVVERRFPAGRPHGRLRIGDIAEQLERAEADPSILQLVGGAAASAPHVFFDLETTGLSGGAGTHAFLIGCGWLEAGAFVIRQHLLVDYAAERSMLGRAGLDFLRAGSLVSFNGKSFDAPVLDTRYLFHRLEWPGTGHPHIDALHPARRFWRQTPGGVRESCSLVALEEEILGVTREGDVPGFEIPGRYFNFVRSGDARGLAAVFEHNRLDLLSLAGLTGRLVELVCDGAVSARNAWEAVALAHVYARGNSLVRARAAFEHAVEMSAGGGLHAEAPGLEALRGLALLLRRARQYDDAASCWRRLLDVPSCPHALAREANEALAIHHEHRVRDLAAAKVFALQSLENGGRAGESGWNDAVRHRLQRIERKMAPSNGRPLFPSSLSSSPSPRSCGFRTSEPRTSS
jgi:hypothetical protein